MDNIYFWLIVARVHHLVLSHHTCTSWIQSINISIIFTLKFTHVLVASSWLIHHFIKLIVISDSKIWLTLLILIIFLIITLGLFIKHRIFLQLFIILGILLLLLFISSFFFLLFFLLLFFFTLLKLF